VELWSCGVLELWSCGVVELWIATASELKDRKYPGRAYCVYNRWLYLHCLHFMHLLVDNAITTHDEYNQLS
jgi:hypothetical protein